MGVILLRQLWDKILKLLPRYGGYSLLLQLLIFFGVSCFPVMGVIPVVPPGLVIVSLVASPLWGLFCSVQFSYFVHGCFPVMGVIPKTPESILWKAWLLPRYGGYSWSWQSIADSAWCCFPVMGVILHYRHLDYPTQQLLPRYGGYYYLQRQYAKKASVASPLWGLF